MKKKWQGAALLALAVLSGLTESGISANRDAMQIIQPKDKTYFTGGQINLITAADPLRLDRISFSVNKKAPVALPVDKESPKRLPNGMINICNVLSLDEGENTLTISGFWQGKEVEKRSLSLFFAAKYSRDKSVPPSGYQASSFHAAKEESLCYECHKELIQPAKKTTVISDSPCYKCHSYVVAEKFKHGPAAVGDCTSCHTGSDKNRYSIARPLKKLCNGCHEEAIKSWNEKKYVHGPAATGDCAICHTPHSSREKFFLRKKTNALCIGCHEEKASGKHVIASFVFGNTHPVAGSRNPMKPDRSFSCASCHSPHAANTRGIFAFDTPGGRFGICQACHKK